MNNLPLENKSLLQVTIDSNLLDLAVNYVKKRQAELKEIPLLVSKNDFLAIQFIGHKIRGNAALFGLNWLGEAGCELEEAAEKLFGDKLIALSLQMLRFLENVKFNVKEDQ